jgi:hypothetical protein
MLVLHEKQIGGRGFTRPVRAIKEKYNDNENEFEGRYH